jgi:hypothetical protein
MRHRDAPCSSTAVTIDEEMSLIVPMVSPNVVGLCQPNRR